MRNFKLLLLVVILISISAVSVLNATTYYSKVGATNPNLLASWTTSSNGSGGSDPTSFGSPHIFRVRAGQTMTCSANWNVNSVVVLGGLELNNSVLTVQSSLSVTGFLDFGTSYVDGAGTFTASTGGNLNISSPDGITASSNSGSVRTSGARTYSGGATYTYNGTSAQVTGDGLPTVISAPFNIDNSLGVSLTNNLTLSDNTITFASGNLSLNTHSLLYALYNLKLTGGSISDISYDDETTNTYGAFTSIPSTWIINGSGVSAIDLYFTIGAISTAQAKAWKRIAGSADAWSMIDVFAYNTVTEPYFGSKDKVSIPAQALKNGAKGSYEYTLSGDDQTLPIELSSFTAVTTAEYFVELHWITQSETDVSGYYVFRSLEDNVSSAIQVSTFIPATNTSTEAEYSYVDEEVMPNTTYFYWLQNMDMNGDITYHGPVTVHVNDNNGGGTPEIPLLTSLQKVYPNPFFNSATISYGLAKNEAVTIEIYNVKGSKVRTLVSSTKASGNYRETWNSLDSNGNACPSGVYYIKMTAGKYTTTQKAVLVK